MHIQLLKSFITVAKLNNITRAAEQMNFTQPAVSAQLNALEKYYGTRLFNRIGKNMALTDAGRCLLECATHMMDIYDESFDKMRKYKIAQNELKIAVSTQFINYLLLDVLCDFQRQTENLDINVERCMTVQDVLRGMTIDRSFDVGFIHNEDFPPELKCSNIWTQDIIWVGNKELLQKHNFSENIFDYPLVNYKHNSVYRAKLIELVDFNKFKASFTYSDSDSVRRAVLSGIGISFLPRVMIKEFLDAGTLIPFANAPHLNLCISLIYHKNLFISPTIQRFFKTVEKYADAKFKVKLL